MRSGNNHQNSGSSGSNSSSDENSNTARNSMTTRRPGHHGHQSRPATRALAGMYVISDLSLVFLWQNSGVVLSTTVYRFRKHDWTRSNSVTTPFCTSGMFDRSQEVLKCVFMLGICLHCVLAVTLIGLYADLHSMFKRGLHVAHAILALVADNANMISAAKLCCRPRTCLCMFLQAIVSQLPDCVLLFKIATFQRHCRSSITS